MNFTKADLAEGRRFFETLRDQVSRAIASGKSLEETKRTVLLPQYKDWAYYDTCMTAAGRRGGLPQPEDLPVRRAMNRTGLLVALVALGLPSAALAQTPPAPPTPDQVKACVQQMDLSKQWAFDWKTVDVGQARHPRNAYERFLACAEPATTSAIRCTWSMCSTTARPSTPTTG